MGEPFMSEIRAFAFDFAPKDWAKCDGALLTIQQYPAIYSLLGTTFGGNGTTNFAIPDLQGRTPIHRGILGNYSFERGQYGGLENVTLTEGEMPPHTHGVQASVQAGDKFGVNGRRFAVVKSLQGEDPNIYTDPNDLVAMNPGCVTSTGGGASHVNIQPTQVVNYCISLEGVFPSRN